VRASIERRTALCERGRNHPSGREGRLRAVPRSVEEGPELVPSASPRRGRWVDRELLRPVAVPRRESVLVRGPGSCLEAGGRPAQNGSGGRRTTGQGWNQRERGENEDGWYGRAVRLTRIGGALVTTISASAAPSACVGILRTGSRLVLGVYARCCLTSTRALLWQGGEKRGSAGHHFERDGRSADLARAVQTWRFVEPDALDSRWGTHENVGHATTAQRVRRCNEALGMAAPHHWPPELSKLVSEAVGRLNRSKRDVLAFFAACGVPDDFLQPWRLRLNADLSKVYKSPMADEIVARINEKPDASDYIRMRREIIRRIVETRSFDQCWPDDRAIARGLVASVREFVQERDFLTKTVEATERLHEARRRERAEEIGGVQARAAKWEELRRRFYALFALEGQGQRRGYEFQKWLNDLFAFEGISIREAFTVGTAEQIDGAIALDGHVYLVEARWWSEALGHKDVSDLYVKVSGRPIKTRGLFISGSGFTDECIKVCTQTRMSEVVLMTAEDIVHAFEKSVPVSTIIRKKVECAATEGRIYVSAREIIEKLGI
jgi:restriction system protein